MKPPGWIMCPHCHGTTYVFKSLDKEEVTLSGLTATMTNQRCNKCTNGFIELK